MRLLFLILTAMLLAVGCLPLSSPGATGSNIFVSDYKFSPKLDSVVADRNDTVHVTFRWADSSSIHTVVWDSGPAGAPAVVPEGDQGPQDNGTYSATLTLGYYGYHCKLHPEYDMRGEIAVVPFGTMVGSGSRVGYHAVPGPALVTRSSPEAAQESPRRAARRSRPATS
jgi:plastocyanin